MKRPDRRRFLEIAGGIGALALAGCTDTGGDNETDGGLGNETGNESTGVGNESGNESDDGL